MQEAQVSATQALINAVAMLTAPQEPFKVGDVIIKKQIGIDTGRREIGCGMSVVTRIHPAPLPTTLRDAQDHRVSHRVDIAALQMAEWGGFVEVHLDSRYFRLATPEEIAAWDSKKAKETE